MHLSAVFFGFPSYGQTKFNLINFSIIHTTTSRIPTITVGVCAFIAIFTGVTAPVINGLPRFLLAGLLVYSGAGFLFEKLWLERKKMPRTSFAIVWTIFVVNFVWEFFIKAELPDALAPLLPGLLVVFLLGIVLAAFEFIAARKASRCSRSARSSFVSTPAPSSAGSPSRMRIFCTPLSSAHG